MSNEKNTLRVMEMKLDDQCWKSSLMQVVLKYCPSFFCKFLKYSANIYELNFSTQLFLIDELNLTLNRALRLRLVEFSIVAEGFLEVEPKYKTKTGGF